MSHPGTYTSFARLLQSRRTSLASLRSDLDVVDPARLALAPHAGVWSCREVLEHLALVGEGILAIAEKLLARGEAAGEPPGPFRVDLHARLGDYRDRRFRTRAPFEPAGRCTILESLDRLDATQSRLEAIEPRLSAVNPDKQTYPHWVFGPLTLAEWLAFLPAHEHRHLSALDLPGLSRTGPPTPSDRG